MYSHERERAKMQRKQLREMMKREKRSEITFKSIKRYLEMQEKLCWIGHTVLFTVNMGITFKHA
jgi:hypothetical protein